MGTKKDKTNNNQSDSQLSKLDIDVIKLPPMEPLKLPPAEPLELPELKPFKIPELDLDKTLANYSRNY